MSFQVYQYVILDGNKYPVVTGSYVRKWARSFSSQLAGNIIRLNFIDRGPGIRVYDMTILIKTWAPTTGPYINGVTATWDVQLQNLEASYGKVATVLQFVDPLGQSPSSSVAINGGVFFTNLNQIIPNYATNQTPYVLYEVELTEATQVVA